MAGLALPPIETDSFVGFRLLLKFALALALSLLDDMVTDVAILDRQQFALTCLAGALAGALGPPGSISKLGLAGFLPQLLCLG